MLVWMTGARRILEVGMFYRLQRLAWAEALPADGRLITCDINPQTTAIAERYFKDSPHGYKIEVRLEPAMESLIKLQGPFDICFIDADKGLYGAYYDLSFELVCPGGLIVLDNELRSGRVLEPTDTRAQERFTA